MEKNLKEKIEEYFSRTEYKKAKEIVNDSKTLFVKYLMSIDPRVDEEFTAVIRLAVDQYISINVLSRELGPSKPTIKRWISGENCPHPTMRPLVLELIARRLCE